MPPSSPRHLVPSNRPSHHNRTTHAAFANTVRNTLDTPLPPTPPSPYMPSPNSSSSSSSSFLSPIPSSPRFHNNAPPPRRGSASRRPSAPDAFSGPMTPQSPSSLFQSPNISSGATTLVDDSPRRSYIPSRAFSDAQESPPSQQAHDEEETANISLRPSPGRSVAGAARRAPPFRPSQSAHLRSHDPAASRSVESPTTTTQLDPSVSLPRYLEELYLDLGVIAALPSLDPRDHLASVEAMNDTIAVWATTNRVAGLHVVGLVQQLRIAARFEGTLGVGDAEGWMRRRGLSGDDDGEGTSFAARMRRRRRDEGEKRKERRDGAAAGGAVLKAASVRGMKHGEEKWRDLPLVLVLMYLGICDVDLARMADRELREMLADWAGRYWPVSDEKMEGVMMEWGSETKKVDVDPRKWRREDEGKVETVAERISRLGVEDVRRSGTLVERLVDGARRSVSVRMSKR